MKQGTIKAVHDDDLARLLDSLGVLNDVYEGKKKCYFCGQTITLGTIECIFPKNGEVNICCSARNCYVLLLEERGEQ